jgi:enamine deaminase RidA (YjgF/YER057c/UK114 family)
VLRLGRDAEGNIDVNDTAGQIKLAFANVEKNLKDAGARGWEDVYLVRSYHTSMADQYPLTVKELSKWTPNHQPTWTCLGVAALAFPAMVVEIEVEAMIS